LCKKNQIKTPKYQSKSFKINYLNYFICEIIHAKKQTIKAVKKMKKIKKNLKKSLQV